jgi:phosphoglycerate kinase
MSRSKFITLDEANLNGKRVLLRVDFNVPIIDGKVADASRIEATIPTIKYLHDAGAAVAILSHLGSPKVEKYDSNYSLAPVAHYLTEALGRDIPLVVEWLDDLIIESGGIVMLENIRFARGEKTNTDELARKMATLCDVYVNEAFASARREQSSVHGIAKYLPMAYTGPLFAREVDALSKALEDVARPFVMVMGGRRRAENKFDLLAAQLEKADHILVAGVIGNTFLKASGKSIGKSSYLADLVGRAEGLIIKAEGLNKAIVMPKDVVCGVSNSNESAALVKSIDSVESDELIMDIGVETIKEFSAHILAAGTAVWTGPMGVVELDKFQAGSDAIANALAASKAYTIANGGDTLALIEKLKLRTGFSHMSTGGGSSLEFLQGGRLPAVIMMEESARVRYAVEREY